MVTVWEWLINNVLSLLPIKVVPGPKGLKPVLNQLQAVTYIDAIAKEKLGAGKALQQLSAIETIRTTADLTNEYSFRYAKRGYDQSYTKQVRVTDKKYKNYDIQSDYSARSINAYGIKTSSGNSDYVYDKNTATLIALDYVARESTPIRAIDISAPFHYGFLQIGDIISIDSDELYMDRQKCLIIEKEYLTQQWRFKIAFEINTIKR